MATINPSVVRAINTSQDLFTISYPYVDTHQTSITTVSKADPAVVSVGQETITLSTTGTIGSISGSGPYTAVISNLTSTDNFAVGMSIAATDGTGSLGAGDIAVTGILTSKSISITAANPSPGTITNVLVNAPSKLPVDFIEGDTVLINGVLGMTQLATAGIDGTNQFVVGTVNVNSFELAGVDSTGFSTATANTGSFQTFSVPEYDSIGSTATALFSGTTNSVGSNIAVDLTTGLITLTGGSTYSLTGIASVNSAGATYQWYDFTNDLAVGYSQPVGTPVTALFKNDADADLGLVVTSKEGTTFSYPAQITDAQAFVEEVSGFVA